MSQIEKVFRSDGEKLNVKGGAAVAALLFLLWFVIVQTNQQKYFVTVVFAVLLVAQSDPGGAIGKRVEGMSAFAVLGALVTAFGFYVGDEAWGFVVLAVFAVTLAVRPGRQARGPPIRCGSAAQCLVPRRALTGDA